MRPTHRPLLAVLLFAVCATAHADTAWVVDRLQLGLHESDSTGSPVLALLESGSAVEVLERNGELARVRIESGAEGWVDAAYISDSKPAALLLVETEAARLQAVDELEAARQQVATLQATLASAGTPAMAGAIQSASGQQPVSSHAMREMQRLQEDNQRLRQVLAQAEANPAAAHAHYLVALLDWSLWPWLLLVSLLVLAVAGGAWMSDFGVRRRHGGFRLRI